ncbi:nucleotidyltransferase family protein [Billgrantia desiderata]|uniref:Nucleotidyltransferase family protein n=1 Tax=Billgrantia desiderata TaxID=52021 RepID=A0AAW4YMF7_9GAMM|nr:nucleotidyltransferase family protein [Halomonas desiderata]MCE8028347.1 nucleotidyltransferase family protein [Halomonas desiderata]MCE8042855.1 nucleotidyltransferase family protein [Halomonas desiderata]MCE8047629.1 nucleotidyltransferase family protein [Halomonas desiderata]MCE8050244.1 nucleotidyltransferase family protein [Halomonas desiderata]NIC39023.1 nucleotidyltransferase family protein [Halomonas desiderata]
MPSDTVAALVLAAGRARRFGNDKRLAHLPQRGPLLAATLATLRPHFGEIRVVVGIEDDPVQLGIAKDIGTIVAATADQGMGASLAAGIRMLRFESQAAAVAVMLGDMPWLSEDTFALLCSRASDRAIVRPIYRGQGGHPVLFGRCFWGSLEQLTDDEGARSVVRRHQNACIEIEVHDPGVVQDVDRPWDLDWARRHGR